MTDILDSLLGGSVVAKSTSIGNTYTPMQSIDAERYTFGAVTGGGDPNAVRKALWDFAKGSDKVIRDQSGREIGRVVEWGQWYSEEVDPVSKAKLPAGTAYLGIQWTPKAWPLVKAGNADVTLYGAPVKVTA